MIQCQLKLRLTKAQEKEAERYLLHLASIWNWGLRKIELNAADRIYFSKWEFQNLLAGHSKRLDVPSQSIQGILANVHDAWTKCFKKLTRKPRFKGNRNRLNSIPFPAQLRNPKGSRLMLPGLLSVRFHKMAIPEGRIKCSRMVKRSSGWYLCLFIDADPQPIERKAFGVIGIDPGFSALLTTSDGEVIEHPRELEAGAKRLAQAKRGKRSRLTARLSERIGNRKKDRNHKLSRHLVETNIKIVFSADGHRRVARKFGKSVASSGHGQLQQYLAYKSLIGGTEYVEVDARNSTRACNECGSQSGPTGLAGLSVRSWVCSDCGTAHHRDTNAAINTLKAGAGLALGTEIPLLRERHGGTQRSFQKRSLSR